MRILFLQTERAAINLPRILDEMGHQVSCLYNYAFEPNELEAPEATEVLNKAMTQTRFDFVISYYYIPLVSMLCQERKVKYISWVQDSPQLAIYHPSIMNSCNRVFIFDKMEANRLKSLDIPHVYHLPLAADTTSANAFVMSDEDEQTYSCDVSFVGSLYEDNMYNTLADHIPSDIRAAIDYYINQNLYQWNGNRPWPVLPSEYCERLIPYLGTKPFEDFEMPYEYIYAQLLASLRLGEIERRAVLEKVAEHHPVEFYTRSNLSGWENIHVHPEVDYYTALGKVYYFSKINLAFTLPTIETGIPLRVFDIMSYGGFVLSNYQEELDDCFEVGKDLAVYHNLDELVELTDYYLSHEEERVRIATNGYRCVNEKHSIESRLKKILALSSR